MATPPINQALIDRFWQRVKKRDDDCWQWMGQLQSRGFGIFYVGNGKKMSAARFSWEQVHGSCGDDVLLHDKARCNNRGCVRPDHLELVSQATAGKRRGAAGAVQTFRELPASMFHGKHPLGASPAGAPFVRAGAPQERRPLDPGIALLKKLAVGVGALARRVGGLEGALKKDGERQSHDTHALVTQLGQLVEQLAEDPAAPTSTVPPPADGGVLMVAFANAMTEVGATPLGTPDELEAAFDVAIAEAGGNSNGATQLFRSWLATFAERVSQGEATPTTEAFRACFAKTAAAV